uniref:Uncharacterized protein n=1 Tax=Romanomermis culicivorax TaxID=13658 RepID=A0A915JDV9_ROMCU
MDNDDLRRRSGRVTGGVGSGTTTAATEKCFNLFGRWLFHQTDSLKMILAVRPGLNKNGRVHNARVGRNINSTGGMLYVTIQYPSPLGATEGLCTVTNDEGLPGWHRSCPDVVTSTPTFANCRTAPVPPRKPFNTDDHQVQLSDKCKSRIEIKNEKKNEKKKREKEKEIKREEEITKEKFTCVFKPYFNKMCVTFVLLL